MNKRSFKYAWVSGQLLVAGRAVMQSCRWSLQPSVHPIWLTYSSTDCRHRLQTPVFRFGFSA